MQIGTNKIHIYCQGFEWDEGITFEEMNFFSPKPRYAITDEIDLMDYAVEVGELTYNFENTDEEDGINTLFFESGNITLKLSGLVPVPGIDGTLKEFFKITGDTSNIKYKVRIEHDVHGLIFQGTVHQDGIKEQFTQGNDNEIIEVLIVGFEKEMKQYFNSVNLISADSAELNWNSFYVGGGGQPPHTHPYPPHIYYKRFSSIVQTLLANGFINNFSFDDDVSSWHVGKHARFVYTNNQNLGLWHNKQSYERLEVNGTKRWQWLEWTCNCMGWTYFIYKDTFYIRNRSGFSLPVTEIDFKNTVIEYEIGKRKPVMTYDYLMFHTGAYYGGDAAFWNQSAFKGERPVILTDKQSFYRNTNHFNEVFGEISNQYQIVNSIGYKFSKYRSEDNNLFSMYNVLHSGNGYDFLIQFIEQGSILRISTGGSGITWSRVRLDEAQDYLYDNNQNFQDLHEYDIVYSGCAGDQLFRITSGYVTMSMNYSGRYGADGYVNSNQFVQNFNKYSDNRNNIYLNVKLAVLLTNPLTNFKFINCSDTELENSEWGIQSIRFNLIDEITELELSRLN
jgi:hypothetical protein